MEIIPILIILGVAILVFILIREIVMWYYKINERIKLMEETNILLRKILMKLPDEPFKEETKKEDS